MIIIACCTSVPSVVLLKSWSPACSSVINLRGFEFLMRLIIIVSLVEELARSMSSYASRNAKKKAG